MTLSCLCQLMAECLHLDQTNWTLSSFEIQWCSTVWEAEQGFAQSPGFWGSRKVLILEEWREQQVFNQAKYNMIWQYYHETGDWSSCIFECTAQLTFVVGFNNSQTCTFSTEAALPGANWYSPTQFQVGSVHIMGHTTHPWNSVYVLLLNHRLWKCFKPAQIRAQYRVHIK